MAADAPAAQLRRMAGDRFRKNCRTRPRLPEALARPLFLKMALEGQFYSRFATCEQLVNKS
jgi:hypothetical protein